MKSTDQTSPSSPISSKFASSDEYTRSQLYPVERLTIMLNHGNSLLLRPELRWLEIG